VTYSTNSFREGEDRPRHGWARIGTAIATMLARAGADVVLSTSWRRMPRPRPRNSREGESRPIPQDGRHEDRRNQENT
jgi:NAD(P)-dependent dehydrogenase (short-subunit alcohol dehydrogenase family)